MRAIPIEVFHGREKHKLLPDLADLLLVAQKKGSYNSLVKSICSDDLVIIIDEMCLIEYPAGGSILLMRLLEKLDEHIAVAFTANRELSDWVKVKYFPDRFESCHTPRFTFILFLL